MDEIELKLLCNKYNIKYKVFLGTSVAILDTGIDEYQIKYMEYRDRPYCLMHKNKIRQTNKFHTQRYLRTLFQVIDSVASHKGILINIYGSPNTYKNKRYKVSSRLGHKN